ncbi:aldehyde dehydrogenase family protein [Joostella sp.]|uniref:aldehyde dehydrogenase family protein n=1 Tax=Joostella sp. TaxID=2231138 RepID=UPI003A925F25
MSSGFYTIHPTIKEPIKSYKNDSPEFIELLTTYKKMYHSQINVLLYIDGENMKSNNTIPIYPTPEHEHKIGELHPAAPVMMENVCIWKPSNSQIYSAKVLKSLWKQIGNNISTYRTYPKIAGETGGKDSIWVHSSANLKQVATAITRGDFEYKGQKCLTASRVYIPISLCPTIKKKLISDVKSITIESSLNTKAYINAVINENSFDRIASLIEQVKLGSASEIIVRGGCNKSEGCFIEPTVILIKNLNYTMFTELFGPVITIFVYEDSDWINLLKIIDQTSEYALKGAILSEGRYVIDYASDVLEDAVGDFNINYKPTGALVGQQPFGDARSSVTNDKAGSILNLLRWVSSHTIKETFFAAKDYKYLFLG